MYMYDQLADTYKNKNDISGGNATTSINLISTLSTFKAAIAITRNSRKTRKSSNSLRGEFRVIVLALYIKKIIKNFSMTRGNMLGSENSEFRVIVSYSVLKNYNLEFFRVNESSKNEFQVCLVSSKTQRVNQYFSNSVKD